MKKIIVLIVVAFVPFFANAQASVFDKFEGNEEVTTIVVSKKMFELMAQLGGGSTEAKEYGDMVGSLSGLKVFITNNKDIALDMQKTIDTYLKPSGMTELMRVDDKESDIRIYVKEGKDDDHVEELLMFVNGIGKSFEGGNTDAEALIFSLVGDIDLNKISKLTEGMNISGSEHLKNVTK
ncbi:MAG: DUF4252 domain-containing protein [Flavobacteriaceae bacterium]|nr:DUF4252 domain-containing protein [Flavobacteriaceae bacterium]